LISQAADSDELPEIQASWGKVDPTSFSLILFAGEFKRVPGQRNINQLLMSLSTAQHHRRALGLDDAVIFGATSAQGIFDVTASWWTGNYVLYGPAAKFDLNDPVGFLQCYFFLCKLHDVHFPTMVAEIWDYSIAVQSLRSHPWRADDAPSRKKRRLPGPSEGSRDNGGNVEGDHDLEQEEEEAWTQAYSVWRAEGEAETKTTGGGVSFESLLKCLDPADPIDQRLRSQESIFAWQSKSRYVESECRDPDAAPL